VIERWFYVFYILHYLLFLVFKYGSRRKDILASSACSSVILRCQGLLCIDCVWQYHHLLASIYCHCFTFLYGTFYAFWIRLIGPIRVRVIKVRVWKIHCSIYESPSRTGILIPMHVNVMSGIKELVAMFTILRPPRILCKKKENFSLQKRSSDHYWK